MTNAAAAPAALLGARTADTVTLLVVIVGLVLAAAAMTALVWRQLTRARRARIQAWAAARGWTYVGSDRRFLRIGDGPPYDAGLVRWMRHLIHGPVGDDYVGLAFQLTNLEYTGRHFSVRTYTVVGLQVPTALPAVLLERETLRTRAKTLVGAQDVELESDEFNRAYRVRAVDPRFASDLLNPRTMERLLRAGCPEVQVLGRHLAMHGYGRLDLDRIDGPLWVLASMCDHLPSFVWTDRGVEAP